MSTADHTTCCCAETIDDLRALEAAYESAGRDRVNLTHRLNQAIAERDEARDTAARLEAELARGFHTAAPDITLSHDNGPATPEEAVPGPSGALGRPGSEIASADTYPPPRAALRAPARFRHTTRHPQTGTPMLDFADIEPIHTDGSHLSPGKSSHIETYMRALLDALGLGAWQVWVAKDLPPEDALLRIEPVEGRRCAMLYVAAHWWHQRTDTEKRVDLTHEALHLAHHDVDTGIRRFFHGSGDIADYVKDLVIDRFKLDLERMVDALSYAIAPHMPHWPEYAPPKSRPTKSGHR